MTPPTPSWIIRPAVAADGPAIAQLEADHPDSGAVKLSWRYKVDALVAQKAIRPGSVCMVAEQDGVVVAMGFINLATARLKGTVRTLGTIYGLVVHAAARRQGIASGLYQALVDHVGSLGGEQAIVAAGVQAENEGSQKAARKWATQAIKGRNKIILGRPPKREPRPVEGVSIREAGPSDWAAIAAGLDSCWGDHQLAPVWSGAELASVYQAQFDHQPLRGYLVAEAGGKLVVGLGVLFDNRVQSGHFENVPLLLRILNFFLHIIPADGELRRLLVKDLWTQRDEVGRIALEALWAHAGWRWRELGNSLNYFCDGGSPVADLLPKAGFTPAGDGWFMVKSDSELELERPIWLPM